MLDDMFDLKTSLTPQGDQPKAIGEITNGYGKGLDRQTLLGATGTGKTFTMAHVINEIKRPTIILSHNKTLAAQLYNEMKLLFPHNAVEYFVSYFDYYMPESYRPASDTYVEKETQVNEQLDRMRLSAMHSLATRQDVIIVASVSCIYGIGDPKQFISQILDIQQGQQIDRQQIIRQLVHLLYQRNDTELLPGRFRVRGDTIDIIPGYHQHIIRISLFDDAIESITQHDPITLEKKRTYDTYTIFAAKQFIFSQQRTNQALKTIREELEQTLPTHDMLEAHRLKQRCEYDIEMIEQLGYCSGIENYSRHFDGRKPNDPPYTILDFFKKDYLMIIDESHVTIPQVHGMYKGDRSRKKNLVEYGFRLPSAYDNRPLTFEEFDKRLDKVLYVSATPAEYEIAVSNQVVEQIIRPTGLLDPVLNVHSTKGQMDHLLDEIRQVTKQGWRTLVTTLTKKMAEHLSEYLAEHGIRCRYLHADIDTLDRIEIIRQLRAHEFDVLVGINLLREGLDIPEVSLVAILDADKEGFLRNGRSLIQTIGRAARNATGRVILYGDKMTPSMQYAIQETARRRQIQQEFNQKHKIVPQTIIKPLEQQKKVTTDISHIPKASIHNYIDTYQKEMDAAVESLDFEKAIILRDKIRRMRQRLTSH